MYVVCRGPVFSTPSWSHSAWFFFLFCMFWWTLEGCFLDNVYVIESGLWSCIMPFVSLENMRPITMPSIIISFRRISVFDDILSGSFCGRVGCRSWPRYIVWRKIQVSTTRLWMRFSTLSINLRINIGMSIPVRFCGNGVIGAVRQRWCTGRCRWDNLKYKSRPFTVDFSHQLNKTMLAAQTILEEKLDRDGGSGDVALVREEFDWLLLRRIKLW